MAQIVPLVVLAHGAEGWADELVLLIGAAAIGIVAFLFLTRDGESSDPPEG